MDAVGRALVMEQEYVVAAVVDEDGARVVGVDALVARQVGPLVRVEVVGVGLGLEHGDQRARDGAVGHLRLGARRDAVLDHELADGGAVVGAEIRPDVGRDVVAPHLEHGRGHVLRRRVVHDGAEVRDVGGRGAHAPQRGARGLAVVAVPLPARGGRVEGPHGRGPGVERRLHLRLVELEDVGDGRGRERAVRAAAPDHAPQARLVGQPVPLVRGHDGPAHVRGVLAVAEFGVLARPADERVDPLHGLGVRGVAAVAPAPDREVAGLVGADVAADGVEEHLPGVGGEVVLPDVVRAVGAVAAACVERGVALGGEDHRVREVAAGRPLLAVVPGEAHVVHRGLGHAHGGPRRDGREARDELRVVRVDALRRGRRGAGPGLEAAVDGRGFGVGHRRVRRRGAGVGRGRARVLGDGRRVAGGEPRRGEPGRGEGGHEASGGRGGQTGHETSLASLAPRRDYPGCASRVQRQ